MRQKSGNRHEQIINGVLCAVWLSWGVYALVSWFATGLPHSAALLFPALGITAVLLVLRFLSRSSG